MSGFSRAMAVPRSLLFYAVFYGGTVLLLSLTVLMAPFSRLLFLQLVRVWCGWHRICTRLLLGIVLKVEGTVPDHPVLFAVKHESMFEAIDFPYLAPLSVVFAKAELLDLPLWGRLARRYGLIGVERDQGARALRTMVAAARDIVGQGRALAIFPEGTRVSHGMRPPLQAGFAGLYKLLDLPVVPIAVDSGALYHHLWKRSGTITFRLGETIPPGLPRGAVEARVHAAINALNPAEV